MKRYTRLVLNLKANLPRWFPNPDSLQRFRQRFRAVNVFVAYADLTFAQVADPYSVGAGAVHPLQLL